MELVTIYEGPAAMAGVLQESLRAIGVESMMRHDGGVGGVYGIYAGLFARVVISRRDAEERADDLRPCLAAVGAIADPDAVPEVAPAEAPGGRGDEALPGGD